MKHKPIDHTKAIDQDKIQPYFEDMSIDNADEVLYETTFKHMCDLMKRNKLNFKQVIQTISLMKLSFIAGMLECKIEHDYKKERHEWK